MTALLITGLRMGGSPTSADTYTVPPRVHNLRGRFDRVHQLDGRSDFDLQGRFDQVHNLDGTWEVSQ